MNRLEEGCYALLIEGKRLEPVSLERNQVGFCEQCQSDLESLAYHRTESGWLVSARCKEDHLILMRYDLQWNWLGDLELQMAVKDESISSLPREKLEAVFTSAEIRDMLACEQNQPYIRQNLYRARAKYEKFEKLFGIKIKI
ncbi:MAG: hypothetical protein NTV25_01435 [Methanothrix sp.]|nr:hypothetical protein [Methanothrix sp.]